MDYSKPHEVDNVTLAFPANVCGTLLPPKEVIPQSFWLRNEWTNLASKLFFEGGKIPSLKDGIDSVAAYRHISACLASFEPKHEHKEAGVGYLLSLWCKEITG